MDRTAQFLEENYQITGALAYSLHVPMVVNKHVMRNCLLATGLDKPHDRPDYHMRTIYGNVARVGGAKHRDPKVQTTGHYTQYRPGFPFASTSDRAFAGGYIGKFIKAQFPDPSPYEHPTKYRTKQPSPATRRRRNIRA
jgi:hypothetical protein